MPSFADCIAQSLNAGNISKELADRIKNAQDPETAISQIVGDITRAKREAAIQAVRIADAWKNIQSYAEKDGGTLYDGLIALMTKDPTVRADYGNVEYLGKYYEGKYHAQFAELLSRFRTRSIGFTQDTEGLKKLVKAIYGESVDDPDIMRFAKDWKGVTDNIRNEFNAKGGSIPKNEKWLMPQNHDAKAILKIGLDEWKAKISNLVDRNQILDDTGRPLDNDSLEEALDQVYETITTNGINKTRDFAATTGSGAKLSRRGSERRFLFFKDADSWLEYQKEFGKGDIFTTLTDHVDSKANDIALMEIFGTKPREAFEGLLNQVQKTQKLKGRQTFLANALFKVVSGEVNQGELTGVADFFQSVRNILVSSTLGSAFLSALSDTGFSAITSKFNGIPAAKVFQRQLSLLNPKNENDRIFAVKMGLIADAWLGRAHGSNRYSDIYGTGVTAKAAEAVMRGSLLSPWTDAGRKGFGMEFSSMLADNFGKTKSELDDSVQRAFDNYGITDQDWNKFRKTPLLTHKGANFADMTQDGGIPFHRMVMSETDFAVPTPDAKVRAITTGGIGRSTIEGQGWRSVMMLKSFPVTIATTHFYRAAYQATTADKMAYAGLLAVSTTVMGGLALQAKDIAAGREPRPVDEKFLAASFQQGGGLGIFGDFLFSDVNRFGGGLTQTIVGPTGELLDKSVQFTLGNVRQAVLGEETNVLGEGAQFLKRYTPDVWQTRLFTDAFFDQVEMMSNPKSERRFRSIVRKRQKQYNQNYWWKPGNVLPEAVK